MRRHVRRTLGAPVGPRVTGESRAEEPLEHLALGDAPCGITHGVPPLLRRQGHHSNLSTRPHPAPRAEGQKKQHGNERHDANNVTHAITSLVIVSAPRPAVWAVIKKAAARVLDVRTACGAYAAPRAFSVVPLAIRHAARRVNEVCDAVKNRIDANSAVKSHIVRNVLEYRWHVYQINGPHIAVLFTKAAKVCRFIAHQLSGLAALVTSHSRSPSPRRELAAHIVARIAQRMAHHPLAVAIVFA